MENRTKRIRTVTGPKGSGKSTAIAYFLPPKQIHQAVIVDTEDSMSDILENMEEMELEFGAYIRMYDFFTKGQRKGILDSIAAGKLPWVDTDISQSALIKYWEHFINSLAETLKGNLDKLEDERLIYLGIDTIEPIEASFAAWVEQNMKAAGWSGTRAYGRKETEGVRPLYEGWLEGVAFEGVTDIGISSHLKPVWEDTGNKKARRIPNKVQTGGRIVVLSRLSSQMWWLVPNVGNPDGAPAGLRIKARKGHTEADMEANTWSHRSVLPARIPHFTWEDVRRYEREGCDLLNPASGEVPTKAEREMISEFLSEEQMRLMVMGAEMDLEEAKVHTRVARERASTPLPGSKVDEAKLAKAKELRAEGMSDEEIKEAMLEALPPPLRALPQNVQAINAAVAALSDD